MEPKITKEGLFQFTQHFTQFVSFKKKSLILETCIFSKQYSSTIIRALKEYTTCEKTKTLALTIQTSRPKFKFFVTNRPIFICPWISRLRGHNKCITQNVTIFIMQYSRREILWGITFKLLCLCLTWKMREFLKKQINFRARNGNSSLFLWSQCNYADTSYSSSFSLISSEFISSLVPESVVSSSLRSDSLLLSSDFNSPLLFFRLFFNLLITWRFRDFTISVWIIWCFNRTRKLINQSQILHQKKS